MANFSTTFQELVPTTFDWSFTLWENTIPENPIMNPATYNGTLPNDRISKTIHGRLYYQGLDSINVTSIDLQNTTSDDKYKISFSPVDGGGTIQGNGFIDVNVYVNRLMISGGNDLTNGRAMDFSLSFAKNGKYYGPGAITRPITITLYNP